MPAVEHAEALVQVESASTDLSPIAAHKPDYLRLVGHLHIKRYIQWFPHVLSLRPYGFLNDIHCTALHQGQARA